MADHADSVAVGVIGLAQLRRDLKALGDDLPKELTSILRDAAEEVLPLARAFAPRRTGRLAASLRARAAGNKASIRSSLPYANVQHWGGTTGPGHQFGRGSVYVRPTLFATRAIKAKQPAIANAVNKGLTELGRRHGWE